MRIIKITMKVMFFLAVLLTPGACGEKIAVDPCQDTKWPQAKEFEIKLAVRVLQTNPTLPGAAPGSEKPWQFSMMTVNGTLEKIECNDETTGPVNLGNTYITQENYPEPVDVPITYWIGHVVYVYAFDNDEDHLDLNLTVKITMEDGQSYRCSFSDKFSPDLILQAPGELYYYILLDIYSGNWVKV